MTTNNSITAVRLTHYRPGIFQLETVSSETRLFSTLEKAEQWLRDNGFVYKHFDYLNEDAEAWGHKTDEKWSFVNVDIITCPVDSDEKYFHQGPGIAPWIQAAREEGKEESDAKFLVKFVRENGNSLEQAAEILEKSVEECEQILKAYGDQTKAEDI